MRSWIDIRSVGQEAVRKYHAWLGPNLDTAATNLVGQPLRGELYRPLEVVRFPLESADVSHESRGRPPRDARPRGDWKDGEEEKEKPRPVRDVVRQSAVILGDPGAGKSELLRQTVRDLLAAVVAAEEPAVPPVYLRVAELAQADANPSEFAAATLAADLKSNADKHRRVQARVLQAVSRQWPPGTELERDWLLRFWWEQWLTGHAPFLALDGWDEIPGEQRTALAPDVQTLLAQPSPTVLTSRIVGYGGLGSSLEWQLCPLGLSQAQDYVRALFGPGPVAEAMTRELAAKPAVAELAGNPLALALIGRVYQGDNPLELPVQRGALYERVIRDLLGEAEARRKGVVDTESWRDTAESKRQFLEQLTSERYPEVVVWSAREFGLRAEAFVACDPTLRQVVNRSGKSLREWLQRDHGLLVPYGANSYALVHKALLDYLAACHLATKINLGGFDVMIDAWEEGRSVRVNVRHFLNRKVWSPAHHEMIRLLGSRVEDFPELIEIIRRGEEDDFLRRRLCLAAETTAEVPQATRRGHPVMEAMLAELKESASRVAPLREDASRLLAALTPGVGPRAGKPTSELAARMKGENASAVRRGMTEEVTALAPGVGPRAGDLVAELVARIKVEYRDAVRRGMAAELAALAPGVSEEAEKLAAKLVEQMPGESDWQHRERVAEAVAALAPGVGAQSRELAAKLVARMPNESNWQVRVSMAGAVKALAPRVGVRADELAAELLARIEGEFDESVRLRMVEAVRELAPRVRVRADELAAELLAKIMGESGGFVRRCKAEALAELSAGVDARARKLAAVLVARISRDSSDFARRSIVEAVAALESEMGELSGVLAADLVTRIGGLWDNTICEPDNLVRECMAEAVAALASGSEAGTVKLAEELVARIAEEYNSLVRWRMAEAVEALAPVVGARDGELAAKLVARIKGGSDDRVQGRIAYAVARLAPVVSARAAELKCDERFKGRSRGGYVRERMAYALAALAPRVGVRAGELAAPIVRRISVESDHHEGMPLASALAALRFDVACLSASALAGIMKRHPEAFVAASYTLLPADRVCSLEWLAALDRNRAGLKSPSFPQ